MEALAWISLGLSVGCMIDAVADEGHEPPKLKKIHVPVRPIFVIAYPVAFMASLTTSLDAIGSDDIRYWFGLALALMWIILPVMVLVRQVEMRMGAIAAVFFAMFGARFIWHNELLTGVVCMGYAGLLVFSSRLKRSHAL